MEIPAGISESAWNDARHMLSEGFTKPISGTPIEVVIEFAKNLDALRSYDFKLVTWDEFANATDLPNGLLDRAKIYRANSENFVVYDPLDDDDGFLSIDMNPFVLASYVCEYIAESEPEEGPLSVDALTMATVEGN